MTRPPLNSLADTHIAHAHFGSNICLGRALHLLLLDMSLPELSDVVEKLHEVREKWYSIGIQLKVPASTLKAIESNTKNVDRALCDMIDVWLKQIEPKPTWAGIVKALRCRSVDESLLAKKLESEFSTPSAASSATPNDATVAVATGNLLSVRVSGGAGGSYHLHHKISATPPFCYISLPCRPSSEGAPPSQPHPQSRTPKY